MEKEKNKERIPQLRFPEFKNAPAWEQRKLGEVAEIVGGGTPSTSNPEYWDGDIDWYAPAEIGEKTFVSESKRKISKLGLEKSSAKLLPVGTVLFTSRAGIGNTAILAKSATTNQGFQSIVPKENLLYSYFIYSMTGYLKHYGEVTGAGSTFVEVSGKQMAKCPISLPSLPEQKAIGDFFSTLDRSIALHQRELENLKNRKKSLLQKMFPKNGESVPKIRFPEFKNAPAWEQRKLGEVAVSFSGGTPSIGNSKYYNGEIPFIRSAEINSAITELYLTEEGLKNSSAKMVNVGDILYALYGATSGEVGISKINGAINQAILAIKPYDAYNSKFIEQWLKNQKKNIIDKYLQGGQGNLSAAIVKKLLIPFPSLPEQTAIGDFFSTLDLSLIHI